MDSVAFKPLDTEFEHKDSAVCFTALGGSIFKLGELGEKIREAFRTSGFDKLNSSLTNRGGWPGYSQHKEEWLSEGIICEILKPGSRSWQPGKLRVKVILEFASYSLEEEHLISPLDELRR